MQLTAKRPIFTIGHSTRTVEEFIQLLQGAGIEVLVDVRRYPGSRRYPQFGKEALAQSLRQASIDYDHEEALGGRRNAQADSRNVFWLNAQFRGYADYMAGEQFRAALDRILTRAQHSRVALMCAEAVPWRCHRQLIADALVARGIEVRNILQQGKQSEHVLNPHARVLADGSLVYDDAEPTQIDLLGK